MSVLLQEDLSRGVRLLTLNRPKPNAFNSELAEALSRAMAEAVADEGVRAVVLTGQGGFFSNGLDFKHLARTLKSGPEVIKAFGDTMKRAYLDVWTCPKPTVAAVNGNAVAGGYFMALACDFRLVLEGGFRFGMNELLFGAGFPRISIEIGRYALGRDFPRAILEAELFDWREGLRNGSFHQSFATQEELLAHAVGKAATIGAMPGRAWAHVKKQILEPYVERVLNEAPENEQRTFDAYAEEESVLAMMEHMKKF